ncbi:MAG: hypothetical protein A2Y33_13965 [Spirochaetes bacterium GWF1_51_8]|nr:MAG: hypothetical protein A2Y33_13965 [Spirochaetes bacterium GWF1_51_8]
MHEYPAVEQIVKIALKTAEEHQALGVLKVGIAIGELSGFAEESLTFYYDILKKDHPKLQNSELIVRYIKPVLRCALCGSEYERDGRSYTCPKCGGKSAPTKTGTEFYIENIEIENEE